MSDNDDESMSELLQLTSPELLAFFERRVSPREDAADLLNETMLQAWRREDSVPEDHERRRMWLFTIAHNVLSNHRRSTRRRSALVARIRAQLAVLQPPPDPFESSAVRDAVLRLPKEQCELVMLIHWDGFNINEAAEVLGLNASTARSRYARARELLRTDLQKSTRDEEPIG
jgi:RNA polymerase sigma-70 factor (ECF subfamily)